MLNWGLGHATRSIPVINKFIARGHKVILASDGRAAGLLNAEYPDLPLHRITSYSVSYPFKSMFLNLSYQWPKVVRAMIKEHLEVRRIVKKYDVDIIISDNRYGCFSRRCTNVIITHQINPPTSLWLSDLLSRLTSLTFLFNFQQVWIPDDEDFGPMAGPMVNSPPKHTRFVGFLSRFESTETQIPKNIKYDILVILSGPEPLRTRFEEKVIDQLQEFTGTYLIVRGKPEKGTLPTLKNKNGDIVNFLTGEELIPLVKSSRLIVSRSGYTSLMDYLAIGARALIVPTPGQYEQEYLAGNIPSKAPFIGQTEDQLAIVEAFQQLDKIPQPTPYSNGVIDDHIDNLLREA